MQYAKDDVENMIRVFSTSSNDVERMRVTFSTSSHDVERIQITFSTDDVKRRCQVGDDVENYFLHHLYMADATWMM